jgi:hypothetical protein
MMKKEILTPTIKGFMVGTILKRYLSILSLALLSFWTFANPPLATKEQIGMFKNSKTCVVLENGSLSYNVYLKDAVQKYWKSTQFEFIDKDEFEKRRYDSKYSFLVLMKGTYDKDPGGISYNYISLVMGDVASDVTNMPELCSIPLSYADDNNIDYGYAMPSIVKFMQNQADNLEKIRFHIVLEGLKYYDNPAGFKGKVLLLNKDMMATEANTTDKIKSTYPYYVKLLSTAEIEAELKSNPENTLFNFHVGPTMSSGAGRCFEMIFDVEGNLYYYNYRNITNENEDGFNLKDFAQIK